MTDYAVEFTAVVRERYDTGDHGDAHLRLHPDTIEQIRRESPPRPKHYPWTPAAAMAALTGIPMVPDESVPPGQWQLAANTDQHVRRTGPVFQQQEVAHP